MNVKTSVAGLLVLGVVAFTPWGGSLAAPLVGIHFIEPAAQPMSEGAAARGANPQTVNPPSAPRKATLVAKLKDYPEVPDYLNEAMKQRCEGEMTKAIKQLGWSRRFGRSCPSEYIVLYLVFADANQSAAARAALDKAAFEYPSDPEPWVFLGEISIDENRLAEAENNFDHAKQLLAHYKNADRKPRLEKRVTKGIEEVTRARKELNDRPWSMN
jgi:hypothetical protein